VTLLKQQPAVAQQVVERVLPAGLVLVRSPLLQVSLFVRVCMIARSTNLAHATSVLHAGGVCHMVLGITSRQWPAIQGVGILEPAVEQQVVERVLPAGLVLVRSPLLQVRELVVWLTFGAVLCSSFCVCLLVIPN
jgi:hypothetical protein